jgi:hypothetical protein
MSASVDCYSGCVTASPCINGANGVFIAPSSSSFDGATDVAPDSCPIVCNPGFVLENNYCVPVPPCQTCTADTYSGAGETDCTTCIVCNSGYYSSGCQGGQQGVCTPCPVCSDDLYSVGCGGASPGTCTCKPGTYSVDSGSIASLVCVSCQAGTYSVAAGASASDTCIKCPNGKYSNGVGMSSLSACADCPAGGYMLADSNVCVSCPAGTYSALQGATAADACLPCPIGQYSGDRAPACTNCAAGSYAPVISGASACTLCESGKYNTGVGNGVGAPSPNPTGTPYQSYHTSVPRQAGYYCSTYQQGFSGTVTSTNTRLDDGNLKFFLCRQYIWASTGWQWFEDTAFSTRVITPGKCLWAHDSSNCPAPNVYEMQAATFQCLAGCLVATPCVNGANGAYLATPSTFDGVSDITADSCPVQCNPGFVLQDNYCVPQPPCAQCRDCDNGHYLLGCADSSAGVCDRCVN